MILGMKKSKALTWYIGINIRWLVDFEKSNNLDISLEFKIDSLIFNFTNLLRPVDPDDIIKISKLVSKSFLFEIILIFSLLFL